MNIAINNLSYLTVRAPDHKSSLILKKESGCKSYFREIVYN